MAKRHAVELVTEAIRRRAWGQNEAERILGLPRGSLSHFRASAEGRSSGSARTRPNAIGQEACERVLGVPRSAWWTEEEIEQLKECEQRAVEADRRREVAA